MLDQVDDEEKAMLISLIERFREAYPAMSQVCDQLIEETKQATTTKQIELIEAVVDVWPE